MKNIPFILVTLLVFQLDMSGKEVKDKQSENNSFILLVLSVFHFDISGKEYKKDQLKNIPLI